MKTGNTSWKRLFFLFCISFLLLAVPHLVLAESQAKTSVRKITKAKTTKAKTTKTKSSAKKSPPVVIDEAAVHSSFETFTLDWMKKLAEAEEYHRQEQLKVSHSNKSLSAEYVGYLPRRFIAVKKTTSTELPLTGAWTYHEESFSAEYVGYLPQRFVAVKKTTSTETPFIGTLTYYERILRCIGKTKEAATQGPFEQVETIPVKEIFRFTKGKWVY